MTEPNYEEVPDTSATKPTNGRKKAGRKKGVPNKSPSAAAVRTILRMPIGGLAQFAASLTDADLATAEFLAEKLTAHVEAATMDDDRSAVRSD